MRLTSNPLRAKRTLKLLWQSGSSWTVANAVLIAIQGVLPIAALYLMKLIIDGVTASPNAVDKGAAFREVGVLLFLAMAVAVATVIARSLAKVAHDAQAELMSDRIFAMLHAKSMTLDLEYYDNASYYDTLHQAQSQAVYRPHTIMLELIAVVQCTVSLLAIVGLLLSLHWSLAIILLVLALPVILIRLKFANLQYLWVKKRTPTQRKVGYMSEVLTSGYYAKELRLYNLGNYFLEKFRKQRKILRREKLDLIVKESVQEALTASTTTLAVFGAFAIIVYQTIQGSITIGDLVMYHQAFLRGQEFLDRILRNLALLYRDNLFLSNLYTFLDLPTRIIEPPQVLSFPKPMQQGIVFNHVSFQYPTTARQALDDINLTIRPGEVIALVGENGSGKTTLSKLLCRLYDPTSGSITLDGKDIKAYSMSELRHEISVIFQDYVRYHLTAKENVWFGDIGLSVDDERVMHAAHRSGAHEVIEQLPQQYDTILGKLFDEGEELSGGQWQKIALARAFLRDSQLIVLDEPTSSLDPKAEYEVFKGFRELLKDQAAILISHRLSTVKMADRIYVLEHGRLIEAGTHDELIALNGSYAKLFERQAEQYRF